jgi:hypothetical protein
MTCSYSNLPYIAPFTEGSSLATGLYTHGHPNSTYWILSIHDQEFNIAEATASYITSLQLPSQSNLILFILVHHNPTTRTTYADNQVIFNQMKHSYSPSLIDTSTATPSIVPCGFKVVVLPTHPTALAHIRQSPSNPLASNWEEVIFNNYNKMQHIGIWSTPLLRSSVPSTKTLLCPCISFCVKDTATPNTYKLQSHTCADESKMKQYLDFATSYPPLAPLTVLHCSWHCLPPFASLYMSLTYPTPFRTASYLTLQSASTSLCPPFAWTVFIANGRIINYYPRTLVN